ncbi:MAG: nitrous oxide reductase family maturation protein NosD [Cyclobacteriaceae bacterium]
MKYILLALCLCCFGLVQAETFRVSKTGKLQRIKKAIELAKSGDTIIVEPGVYREGNIIIEKNIVLLGKNFPVLDGENRFEILTIHANQGTVSGFKFIDTGVASIQDLAAIKILESKNITVRNNRFENTFFGIYSAGSEYITIEENILTSNAEAEHQIGNGIHLWKCDHITIRNNRMKGFRDGIYFEFVTNSRISGNHSEGNMRYGLHFMFSHDDEYENNTFINNGAGVAVMYSKRVKMHGNTFELNWGASAYGLLLKDISDSHVKNNRFRKNSLAVVMEGSSRISFEENEFSGNGYAVKLQASCEDNVFVKNNFYNNSFDLATNGSLVLNTIDGNYWDHYEGYDLDKNGVGDIPYRPVSLFATVMERVPTSVLLWRSFFVFTLDRAEKAIPAITPENLKDNFPLMKPYDLVQTGK